MISMIGLANLHLNKMATEDFCAIDISFSSLLSISFCVDLDLNYQRFSVILVFHSVEDQ